MLIFVALLISALGYSFADQPRTLPIVGQIYFTNPTIAKAGDDAFRDALRALGYIDGKNVTLVPLYAEGREEQIGMLVNRLIGMHVDVMMVTIKAMHAATRATKTIPIVCPYMGDPIKDGLVKSLAHPGGNFTGLTGQNWELDSKRFELLQELMPGLKRAALLYDANFEDDVAASSELQAFAHSRGIEMRLLGVRTPDDIRRGLSNITASHEKALIVFDSPFTALHRAIVFDLTRYRVPIISEGRIWAEDGAVLTYAANVLDMHRRSASYVAKILQGAKPGDLPIEQAEKFDFVVNLKAAKEFGINVPDSILLRASEVIR